MSVEVKAQNSLSMTSVKAIKDATDRANELVDDLEQEVTALDGRVDTAEGKVTTIEGNITSLDGRVTTAEGKITTAENNITSIGNRVTTAEGNITNIEGDISALDTRVETAEGDIDTIEGNITTINGNVSSLTTRVSTAEGKVTTLEGKVSTAESNITNLQGRISTAESDITNVEGDITTLQGRVTDAETDVTETLHALGVAEAVIDTINWISDHGTMTKTTDTTVSENKVYFVVDASGIYEVGGTHYAIVESPVDSGLSNYYELTTDSAISNYIESHVALTSAGLVVTKDNTKWYVLVKNDGIDIVDNTSGLHKVVASYGASVIIGQNANGYSRTEIGTSGMQIYQKSAGGSDVHIANLGYGAGVDEQGGTSNAPYFAIGNRISGTLIGNFSCTIGTNNEASGYASVVFGENSRAQGSASIAEGQLTKAVGDYSHAEGQLSEARGEVSHAEGYANYATGDWSHAEGANTRANGAYSHAGGSLSIASGNGSFAHGLRASAASAYQTALGQCNEIDSADTYALIIGNGADNNNRSNAFTVGWNGNVVASGDVTDGSGNVLSDKQDTLISGTNIKTINGGSLLGSGDIQLSSSGTSVPTADEVAEFDSTAHMNSTDMTTQEVSDFVDGLDVQGGGEIITPTVSISTTSGVLVSSEAKQYGKVVMLRILIRNTASTASGANMFEGTLNTVGLRPVIAVGAASYYGGHAVQGSLTAEGGITARNASSTAIGVLASLSYVSLTFTYLVE